MASTSTTSSTSSTSSTSPTPVMDTHTAAPTGEGTPTNKHGGSAHTPRAQSWIAWLCDKYTIQYTIPAAYAAAALQISNTVFPLGIVFGLVLPQSICLLTHPFNPTAHYAELKWYMLPQLHLYLLSWIVFHMLEFMVTASYNPTRLYSDSFLLNNGVHYHIAHLASLVEFCLTAFVYPHTKHTTMLTYVGIGIMVAGQTLRSMAMIHAHNNFSHVLAFQKRRDHELVTQGVYAWTRHPSYVGFAYWAVGTQLMLANRVCLVGFVAALWLFFSRRIRAEEAALVAFFGEQYEVYRTKVGTGLPFIK